MNATTFEFVKNAAVKRPLAAHKGSMGTLLSVCGSYSMAGAAILSARAALRSGVGLLRLACVRSLYPIIAPAVPEAVFSVVPDEEYFTEKSLDILLKAAEESTAVLVGCGLGRNEKTGELVRRLVGEISGPLIIDADGINAVSEHINVMSRLKSCDAVLTPHPKEMSRLTGLDVSHINQNREQAALDFAGEYGVTLLLKGHNTVIAGSGGRLLINPTGNPGLATGGSGDVLSGIIASLAAQGMNGFSAAASGAYVHGKTADILAEKTSQAFILPSDIVKNLYLGYQ